MKCRYGIGACIIHRIVYVRALTLCMCESLLAPTTHIRRYSRGIDYYLQLALNYLQSTTGAAATATSKDNLDNFADLSLASRKPGVYKRLPYGIYLRGSSINYKVMGHADLQRD